MYVFLEIISLKDNLDKLCDLQTDVLYWHSYFEDKVLCNYSLFLMNNNDEEYIDIVTNYDYQIFRIYKFRNMEKLEIKHIISSLIQNFQKSKLSTDSKHGGYGLCIGIPETDKQAGIEIIIKKSRKIVFNVRIQYCSFNIRFTQKMFKILDILHLEYRKFLIQIDLYDSKLTILNCIPIVICLEEMTLQDIQDEFKKIWLDKELKNYNDNSTKEIEIKPKTSRKARKARRKQEIKQIKKRN